MAGNALCDVALRLRAAGLHDGGARPRADCGPARNTGENRGKMARHLQVCRHRGPSHDGKEAHRLPVRDEAGRRQGGRGRGHDEARGHGEVRDSLAELLQEMAEGVQGGRPRGAQAEAQGEAEGLRLPGRGGDARAGTRAEGPEARGGERLPEKIDSPEGGEALPNREKAAVVSGLSGQYPLSDLPGCAGLARSSYYYALSHPKAPTRPELWEAAAEMFSRTANGCGHRQIAMCLRAEQGVRIADKTVLKMMREMGAGCGIRRETDCHRYNSYRGGVGKTFENVIGRDFEADGPWEKMGTDVTEFKQPWGKAYFAPVYDFGSKEIVAWSTSLHPDMAQQHELLDRLMSKRPDGAGPILHSDMGWQYQQAGWCRRLEEAGVVQSMSRKGNCIDNGATEQVFGHLKDEFFRGREWRCFEDFKRDLDEYIIHWNTRRRQVKLKGLTPEEFRSQSLVA